MPDGSDLRVAVEMRDGAFVIVADGEIDLVSAAALREAAAGIDGAAPGAPVLVDLAEVEFMDSSGLRALLQARRSVSDAGRAFALLRPSAPVRRVLELVDLIDDIPVVASTEPGELDRLR